MNTRFPLAATKREQIGHGAHQLRKSGYVPATLYGKKIQNSTIAIAEEAFVAVYKQARETHLVDLSVDGKTYPVLIHVVQKHPVSNELLNIEFMTVNLSEKIKTVIPVRVIGESPAVKQNLGTLLITLQDIEIETLPTNIPEAIDIDVSSLEEVGSEITISDIKVPQNVTVLSDNSLTVVKIGALSVEEEVTPPATEEAPATDGETPAAESEGTPEESQSSTE